MDTSSLRSRDRSGRAGSVLSERVLFGLNGVLLLVGCAVAWWAYSTAGGDEPPTPAFPGTTLPPGAAQRPPGHAGSVSAADAERIELTRRGLGRLVAMVVDLAGQQQDYPRSHRIRYGTNRGIESLTETLELRDMLPVPDLLVSDTDFDDRAELADAWGQPLIYFNRDAYGFKHSWAVSEAHIPKVDAAKRLDGTYIARNRFQIWSAGPNGRNEYGGGDDIASWKVR